MERALSGWDLILLNPLLQGYISPKIHPLVMIVYNVNLYLALGISQVEEN